MPDSAWPAGYTHIVLAYKYGKLGRDGRDGDASRKTEKGSTTINVLNKGKNGATDTVAVSEVQLDGISVSTVPTGNEGPYNNGTKRAAKISQGSEGGSPWVFLSIEKVQAN